MSSPMPQQCHEWPCVGVGNCGHPHCALIPADELFQKVAEDYVHFTAFQEMTGEHPLQGDPQGRFREQTLGGS